MKFQKVPQFFSRRYWYIVLGPMSDKKMKRFLNLAFKVRGDTEATEVMVATEVLIKTDLVKFLIYFNSSIEIWLITINRWRLGLLAPRGALLPSQDGWRTQVSKSRNSETTCK